MAEARWLEMAGVVVVVVVARRARRGGLERRQVGRRLRCPNCGKLNRLMMLR